MVYSESDKTDMYSSIDDLLGDGGEECPMVPPKDMHVWNSLLHQLGTIYLGSPIEAFKEYITNSADADASEIKILLAGSRNNYDKIVIIDNGRGMYLPRDEEQYVNLDPSRYGELVIARDSILRLPKSVGDSAKRLDPSKQGSKAIGALAWQSLCESVTFASKKEGYDAVSWACRYEVSDGKQTYKTQFKRDVDLSKFGIEDHGTVVIFDNINEGLSKLRSVALEKDLGSRFRDLVKERGTKITLQDGNKIYEVAPEEYDGVLVVDDVISTEEGDIEIEIFVNPNKNSVVRVKQGIQTLIDDISKISEYLDEDNIKPWSSKMLTGQVKADWLTPGASRQQMEIDSGATIFFEVLRSYNSLLEEKIQKFKLSNTQEKKQHMYNVLERAFSDVIDELPELVDLLSGFRATQRGKLKGRIAEGFARIGSGPRTKTKGRKDKPKKKENLSKNNNKGMPADEDNEGDSNVKQSRTLRYDDEAMPPHMLSRFESEVPVIIFNNSSPEYISTAGDPELQKMFLAGLVGKELMSQLYTEPQELIDKVISFQMLFYEHMPDLSKK